MHLGQEDEKDECSTLQKKKTSIHMPFTEIIDTLRIFNCKQVNVGHAWDSCDELVALNTDRLTHSSLLYSLYILKMSTDEGLGLKLNQRTMGILKSVQC